jgi:hypothetical protein
MREGSDVIRVNVGPVKRVFGGMTRILGVGIAVGGVGLGS